MSRVRLYARNVAANYVGFAAHVVVAFFLTPFIVHALGDTRYGIWSLLVSLAGYFGIVDIGVRGSLGRFVNYYLGKDAVDEVNEILSTAVVFFCACGLGIVLVSGGISLGLGAIFPKIGADFLPQARVAVLLIGLNMWIGFLTAIPPVILRSQDRFDLDNGIQLLGLGVRTALTVWVLRAGWGLVALGLVQVVMTLIQLLVGGWLAKRIWPAMRIRLRRACMRRFREVMSFSIFAFVGNASHQLMLLADMVLITWFLGPARVAYYSVALVLIRYATKVVEMAGGVVVPEVTKRCGQGDRGEIQWLFRRAGDLKACLGIGLWVGILVFGGEFMRNWMGPEFAVSYHVMAILSAGKLFEITIALSRPIAAGLGRMKELATVSVAQLVANVGLTIVLMVVGAGLPGVAAGTTLSYVPAMAVIGLLVARWIGLDVVDYLRTSVLRWILLAAGFVAVGLLVRWALPSDGWGWFCAKAGLAAGAYLPLAWVLVLPKIDKERVLRRIRPRRT